MRILTEIHRNNGINIHGRIIHRTAVRAVILRGRELLMVYSANVGDYKLPGGGVDDDFGAQKLDGYEKDLGFKPVWVDIDEAISMNQSLLNSDKIPEWLKRELFVLDYIQCLM
jgi:hypothetical protein